MQQLNDTAHKILDAAGRHTQTRGFNAFSYRDIQAEIGIKTSSIHYYFPTKQDLAIAMIQRYLLGYKEILASIEQGDSSSVEKLKSLGDVFIGVSKQGKFCLCGMLAADIIAMPKEVQIYLDEFFVISEEWISKILKEGQKEGIIQNSVSLENAAAHFLATLEGGLLIARTRKNTEYLQAVINEALRQITA